MASRWIRPYEVNFCFLKSWAHSIPTVQTVFTKEWQHCVCNSLKKQPTLRGTTNRFPRKWRVRNERRNSILMTHHYPDLDSASDWLHICFNQSGALPTNGWWSILSMEFLRSFLRCHFARKLLVGSQNVGCLLRLVMWRISKPVNVSWKVDMESSGYSGSSLLYVV